MGIFRTEGRLEAVDTVHDINLDSPLYTMLLKFQGSGAEVRQVFYHQE